MGRRRAVPFAKRLERGRFVWPRVEQGTAVLTSAQLSMLLEGIDWRRPNGPGVRRWRFDCDTLTRVAQLQLVSLEIVVSQHLNCWRD